MSTTCRVCGSSDVTELGTVEYVSGFAWPLIDCRACGCRVSPHWSSVHEMLHSEGQTLHYYIGYRKFADECQRLFQAGDRQGLRTELSRISKYKFIIDEVERRSPAGGLLEIGCSYGYLTAWFILAGYRIVGVDTSRAAIEGARTRFGDHFIPADSPLIADRAPYDIIYHVGTIGCVADPIGLTEKLISLLAPDGTLLFNAPNRRSLSLDGQMWIDSAPPPDVVTLFPPGFWTRQFKEMAEVEEEVEMHGIEQSLAIGADKLLGRHWKRPSPAALGATGANHQGMGDRLWRAAARRLLKAPGMARLVPRQPSEFGLFVKMTRHTEPRASVPVFSKVSKEARP